MLRRHTPSREFGASATRSSTVRCWERTLPILNAVTTSPPISKNRNVKRDREADYLRKPEPAQGMTITKVANECYQ